MTAALPQSAPPASLDQAYAACRTIARREAKNFYYAFRALTRERRDGICAIYAFMRQADDLADDESISRDQRRRNLEAWLAEWRIVCKGGSSANPAFVAAYDATQRFQIPLKLLEELVDGVSMDLDRAGTGEPDTYATFPELYRYCYLVASVVGLVSIRIFGYSDPIAEQLAEETGIAFQLTNILRDVPEDAARNRVYLAVEDLKAQSLTVGALLHRLPKAPPNPAERELLAEYARRAENYYQSAQTLIPLIHRESRPALWVLVTIYHALLKRIEAADYDVFSRRASVPTVQKMAILMVGMARMAWARAFG
ncbi:MAG: phytoene/squalene synthase family protein [Acidobacteriota bacterium]